MMLSTAATPKAPQLIPAARPTREERYRAQRVRAARLVAAGLWLAVPAIVACIVGLALPLFVGVVRVEALGIGGALLLAAGGLLLRGRVEIGRARRAYVESRRLHAVRVERGDAS
jgi:hypothetical protein